MTFDSIDDLLTGEQVTVERLFAALALLVIGFGLSYLIGRWRRRLLGRPDQQSQQVMGLITRVAQVLVVAVFTGWALATLGSDVGLLTVVVLVGGLVAFLALRPILEGISASAALTARPAFAVGDEIEVDDTVGTVLEITNRSTVIRRRDQLVVHIPNVEMITKTVTVISVEGERHSTLLVTIDFDSDVDRVEQALRDAMADVSAVSRVGAIRVTGLTVGVELTIQIWHPSDIEAGQNAVDAAARSIKKTFATLGVDFATVTGIVDVDSPHRVVARHRPS